MKTKKILSICLVFILTLILSGCGKNKNEIIMVTEAGFAPYEYYENGEIVGVDVAIAKEIAKELGKKLVVKNVDFDSIVSELKSGKADFAAAGMSITEERKKQVDFTIEYVTSNQVVVVKKDSSLNDITQLDGKRIAVQLGTVGDSYVTENYKNSEINRQKKFLVAAEAVKNNKADCIVMDQIPAQQLVSQNPELKILDGILFKDSYGMAVKKGNTELLDTMNTVLQRLIDEGKIEEYTIKYSNDNFLKKTNSTLNNTLIQDGRYKYILKGLANTLIMSVFAIIIGILFGLFIAIVRDNYKNNKKGKILNFLCSLYVTIIRGTPVVLQLMIIYYIILKSYEINILTVGIIAFGLNSAAYVSEIIRSGIESIDKGQMEAGRSLGFNYFQTMKYIILPQAIKNILPPLCNEFITLIKETSVAGYIGIMDLTKASDIIASRTYDYFFPLMFIAIIYLVLTLGLSKLVNKLERKLNNDARN